MKEVNGKQIAQCEVTILREIFHCMCKMHDDELDGIVEAEEGEAELHKHN